MSAGKRGRAEAESETGNVTPAAHLKAELKRLGLDQVAVSKATGVSRQSVNNIVNGRQAISRAMAGKLGRLTGRPSDYWLSERFARNGLERGPVFTAGLLVNHQIARAVKDGIIGITPFTAKNLQAASIALTLDGAIAAGGNRIVITRGQEYVLQPGRAIGASTVERIELPCDYIGRVGPLKFLATLGIVVSASLQIEPGYKGRLNFWLLNTGDEPFHLHLRAPVIGLEILRLPAIPDKAS